MHMMGTSNSGSVARNLNLCLIFDRKCRETLFTLPNLPISRPPQGYKLTTHGHQVISMILKFGSGLQFATRLSYLNFQRTVYIPFKPHCHQPHNNLAHNHISQKVAAKYVCMYVHHQRKDRKNGIHNFFLPFLEIKTI